MSKPQQHYKNGKDYFSWKYEEQTKMKHLVVKDYFKVWATKLGQYNTVYFFDCFGGCGAYLDEDEIKYGSPFLIAEVANDLNNKLGRKVEIFVTEPNEENYQNLLKVNKDLSSTLSILPHIGKMTFENFMKHDWTKKKYMDNSTPVFFFIDPFGYNLNFADIEDIMKYQKNEMVINFMFDYISRFIGTKDNPKLEATYDSFFGTTEWRDAIPLAGEAREKKLVEIYKKQLKKNAKYVFPYRLSFPDKDRTYYYLFHVTNNVDGCSIMKSVFANWNFGRVEYLGKNGNLISIFDMDEIRIEDIKSYLVDKYSGKEVTFEEIVDGIIDETLFLEKDIRAAVKSLKSEGVVKTTHVSSKTDRGLKGKDIVTFNK